MLGPLFFASVKDCSHKACKGLLTLSTRSLSSCSKPLLVRNDFLYVDQAQISWKLRAWAN